MTWPHAGQYGPDSFTFPSGATSTVTEWALRDLAGDLVDCFTDRDRTDPVANPGVSDGDGNVIIFADPGPHQLTITVRGHSTVFDVLVNPDPADLGAAGTPYDDSIPDDTLGILDPDTYDATLRGILSGTFGITGGALDTFMASFGAAIGTLLDNDQPDDLPAAMTNAARTILFAIALGGYTSVSLGGAISDLAPTTSGVTGANGWNTDDLQVVRQGQICQLVGVIGAGLLGTLTDGTVIGQVDEANAFPTVSTRISVVLGLSAGVPVPGYFLIGTDGTVTIAGTLNALSTSVTFSSLWRGA